MNTFWTSDCLVTSDQLYYTVEITFWMNVSFALSCFTVDNFEHLF